MQSDDLVLLELCTRVVGAINGGHEVWIIEEDGQQVKSYSPSVRVGRRQPRGNG